MPAQESKYAAKLRELGFTLYSELLSPQDMGDVERDIGQLFGANSIPSRLSRQQLREAIRKKVLPSFSRHEDYTYATDEKGIDWQGPPNIDLTPLGFSDNVAWAQKTAKARKEKMN